MTTIFAIFGLFSANFVTPVSAVEADKSSGVSPVNSAAPLSLTLSVPSDPLSLNIQPTNTFTKSSPSSVSVKTDAFAGYSLSVKAQSSNELVNGSSKLTSISENQSEEQYQGEGNLNTWGYKPSKFNSLENTLFLPGPTTSPSVIETTKAANNDAATSYEFVLAAKADATIAHGEYKNTFVFSATANTVSYNIKYELNSGSWEGTSPQANSTAESSVTLDSHAPTRSDYEFKGWCPEETHDENCSTTSYQPGNSYPLINGDNNITLWAMWKPTIPIMQNWTGCANLGMEETITMRDIRDNNLYTVAKLKDGKCWMTQNLRLMGNRTLTPSDSDVKTNFVLPASTGMDSFNNSTIDSHLELYDNSGYYNAFAASAKTNIGLSNGTDVTSSICPKGWKMPNRAEGNAFLKLYSNNCAMKTDPVNLTKSGYLWYGSLGEASWIHMWIGTSNGSGNNLDSIAQDIASTCPFSVNYNNCNPDCGKVVRCINAK